jgi:N6-L-threonylcarbamoyladenine synthase
VLALVVSGGHTHLYLAERCGESWTYQNVGRTRDDAAGEAFDKVAKLLGFGYPGGPVIDRLAAHGDADAVKFSLSQMKHRDRRDPPTLSQNVRMEGAPGHGKFPTLSQKARQGWGTQSFPSSGETPRFDFSYSGIKTAVMRHVETHGMKAAIDARRKALAEIGEPHVEDYLAHSDRETLDLVASFQRAMVEDLVSKTLAAARACNVATLFVTGGVAANQELRTRFEQEAAQEGLAVYFPSRRLATDNAAMIAAAAYPKFLTKDFAAMDFSAEAGMALK